MEVITKLWYAFYCRSRSEKKLHNFLLRDGYDSYLPLKTEIRQWSDRKKKQKLPLLPGYIFVKCTAKDIQSILKYPQVVASVKNLKEHAIIEQYEIDRLILIENGNYKVGNNTDIFKKGDIVFIKSGPFKGCEAIVCNKNNSAIINLHLKSIDVNFTITLDKSNLELA